VISNDELIGRVNAIAADLDEVLTDMRNTPLDRGDSDLDSLGACHERLMSASHRVGGAIARRYNDDRIQALVRRRGVRELGIRGAA
jgi:hypothetical protein